MVQKDTDDDGDYDVTTMTDYVIDANNHTGHAQVIEEWDPSGTPAMERSYVIGHDVIAQADDTNGVLYLLTDGHGSTRVLIDDAGTPAIQETYDYDAYGNLIDGPATPLTTLLYSGEQTDSVTGLQYLSSTFAILCRATPPG